MTPKFAVEWSFKQLSDWKSTTTQMLGSRNSTSISPAPGQATRWMPLEPGQVTVNVDAAIVKGSPYFSVGMVLRNHTGAFIVGRVLKISKEVSVIEAETIGIEEALSWIMLSGVKDVSVESDSLLAV